MSAKSIKIDAELARKIKTRRQELKLTIEEAALMAGVGTKTWCRYESGGAIREDKYKGVCKALNWRTLTDDTVYEDGFDAAKYKEHDAWSTFIAKQYGDVAAASFVVGSDILLDYIEEDLRELAKKPQGTHIGELSCSYLSYELPQQFLMKYDYNFMYTLKSTVIKLRKIAHSGSALIANSVMDELSLYLISNEAKWLYEDKNISGDENYSDWIFDLFDDDDIVMLLYCDVCLDPDNIYHFDHWYKN